MSMGLHRNGGLGWWRSVTLRDVMLFTAPPMALAAWLFFSAVMDYHRARQFDDWWSNATSVRKYGWYRMRTALRSLDMIEYEKHLSAEREDLPNLRLLVDRSDWNRIDQDVGEHWGEWIPVQLLDGGDFFDAELRFRGDGSAHWMTEKKSFTLKTRRNDPFKGQRTLAFSVKDVLPQWLAASLAEDFGLLAPRQELVPVYLNDRFYGIHRSVEPVDEAFLLRHARIPGNVFRADAAERGDYFKGLYREVFKNPYIWELAAENDRAGASGREQLERFLADLNDSSPEGHRRFMAWLDPGEISRLLAYLLVVGDPFHMSGVHNQFWYLDPSLGTFHPIPWDVRLLDLEKPPRDSNINRFWRAALRDRRVWQGALEVLAAKLADDSLYEKAQRLVWEGWHRHFHAFQYDTLRSGIIPPVGDPVTTLATLRKNIDTLRTWTVDARLRVAVEFIDPRNRSESVIDVIVDGRAGVLFERVELERSTIDSDARFAAEVWADANRNGVRDSADERLAQQEPEGLQSVFEIPLSLSLAPGIAAQGPELVPESVHYRFFVRSASRLPFASVRPYFLHGGRPIEPQVAELGEPIQQPRSTPPGRFAPENPTPSILSGTLSLTEDLIIPRGDTLIIEAGTTLSLAPGVSLLVQGRLEAIGTAAQPIVIGRADHKLPWGTLALQGEGASGSRLAHVQLSGGGGATLGPVEYQGMVCVHGALDVSLDRCDFARNLRCDDAIHASSAEVSLTNCRFHDLNGDAVDYDLSGGLIANNRIERAPVDGIELTMSAPRVVANEIRDCGERALLIRSDSHPLVFNNTIEQTMTGVEVRDGAEPVLLHNAILGCERGIHAHHQSRDYPQAGWPKIAATVLEKNAADWAADNGGRRTLIGSLIGARSDGAMPIEDLPDEMEWFLRSQGIQAPALRRGPLESFELVDPLVPIFSASFEESLADVSDGWFSDGGAARLHQRERDLEVNLAGERARVARRHDWDLSDPSRSYLLVLELGGEDIRRAAAVVTSDLGNVECAVEIPEGPDDFGYTLIDLPPRRYDGIALYALPGSDRSRLRLHAYSLFAWPARSLAQ